MSPHSVLLEQLPVVSQVPAGAGGSTHARTHIYTHTHIYAHTYTYTRTHKYTDSHKPVSPKDTHAVSHLVNHPKKPFWASSSL